MPSPFLTFAKSIARSVGKKLLENFGKTPPLTRGSPKEVKSFFDTLADTMIKEGLEREYPDHSYLTEESGMRDKHSDYLWIIDPLDGTSNFVNGNPFFAISIALFHRGEPVMGLIEAPMLGETYSAEFEKGASVEPNRQGQPNAQPFRAEVSSTSDLSKAYLVFCEGGVGNKKRVLETIDRWYTNVKDMRKLGSAALELAWVGVGRADAYVTHAISLWDIAAGAIFVKEAGGKLLNFEGKEYDWKEILNSKTLNLIATNGKLQLR